MKNLFSFVLASALLVPAFAEEAGTAAPKAATPAQEEHKRVSSNWPAFIGVGEYPAAPDLIGLRLTIPYSTQQENVTGIDIGLWSRTLYFEGISCSIIRNDVKDDMSGIQIGLYNSAGRGNGIGAQIGLWNEAACLVGAQVGLVNTVGEARGFQIGLINRAETLYGYQIGIVNAIRDGEVQFFPIINIGF